MTTPLQARAKNRINPVLLFDIVLLNGGGTIYLSERTILVGAIQYQDYILNMADISDAVKRADSRGNNPAVKIKFNNKAFRTYAHLSLIENTYPIAGAKVTIKEIDLDDDDNQSDADTLFVGEFEEIRSESIISFEITAMSLKAANALRSAGKI